MPLYHTWTLSVVMQFYIFITILIVILKNISNSKNVVFFDKEEILCNDLNMSCTVITPNFKNEIIYDRSHYSYEGAIYLGKRSFNKLKKILYDEN